MTEIIRSLGVGDWDLFTCPPRYSYLETSDVNSTLSFLGT